MSVSTPSPYRCPTCKSASEDPRNLAVFIDGTSNKPGDKNTNVMKLFDQVLGREGEQLKHYLKGIGARDIDQLPLHRRVGKAIYSSFEMALAWNVEKNVKDAYKWLAQNYRKGDQIYLFGFSRGAYQVRSLASMIHEVGLVKLERDADPSAPCNRAYDHYLFIDPCNTMTREKTVEFRKKSCWPDVRIHFVGVWDTVSSLGLIKRDVHITASATVTNACHFRHALALDERRVKFMPEYFTEVNPHHGNIQSSRFAISDVKEVWFAGSHSDVGGTSRQDSDAMSCPVHAGNVPLLWMRREAAANGLVFEPQESTFTWDPKDVDFGREDTMTGLWKYLEFLPIRHQVSFSGTGEHERRRHRSRPRSVIPDQQIHSSISSCDVYMPLATLRDSFDIPTGRDSNELWTIELLDKETTTRLLTPLLNSEQSTLGSLEKVLFLLNYRLDNGWTETIHIPQWSIGEQSDFGKVALTVIRDVLPRPDVTEEQLKEARKSLCAVLSSPKDLPRAFYVLRFSTRHERPRQRLVAHDGVIRALMNALEWTARSLDENLFLFPLVMDSLRYLIDDMDLRDNVIKQLSTKSETRQTRLSVALEVKASSHLVASLKMIASLAQHKPDLCKELQSKIYKLAKTERSLVGSAAVEALAALNAPLAGDIHFPNILGYLGRTLPPLDVEVGSTSPPDKTGDLPSVLQDKNAEVGGTSPPDKTGDLPSVLQEKNVEVGSTPPPDNTGNLPPVPQDKGELNKEVVRKLVSTMKSLDTHERTAATLTLLKLCRCRDPRVRSLCLEDKVVHIFMRQMERKKTSLLAAYALKTCLEQGMVTCSDDFDCAAQLIIAMLDKGWFDDAVGRVKGIEIFRGLMTIDQSLRQRVIDDKRVDSLMEKLEGGERDDVRMSLLCLEIVASYDQVDCMLRLKPIVNRNVDSLTANDKKIQTKAVKILAALAQTSVGEGAIVPRVIDIVNMLLPSSDSPSRSRSELFGPIATIYDLCKNETLRKKIQDSQEYKRLKDLHSTGDLLPEV